MPISLLGIVSMDSPYASVTPSSTHLGNFASNLSGGQIYAPGTPLGGAPAAANFNRQHFSPLSLLPPCSSASNGEFWSAGTSLRGCCTNQVASCTAYFRQAFLVLFGFNFRFLDTS